MSTHKATDIFVIASDFDPIRISNGDVRDVIPVGKNHSVDNRLLPLLDDAGIRWRRVGVAGGEGDVGGRAVLAADGFDPEAIIDGNTTEVAEQLAGLTPEQLLRVRDAETDREVARKTVLAAVDKAIAAQN